DRGEQEREVVRLDAVSGGPRHVFHWPPGAGAEGGDLGPELLGEVPAQLEGAGQSLLLLAEQPEDPGALAEQVLDAVEGDDGEVQVGMRVGGPRWLAAEVVGRSDPLRAVVRPPRTASLAEP